MKKMNEPRERVLIHRIYLDEIRYGEEYSTGMPGHLLKKYEKQITMQSC